MSVANQAIAARRKARQDVRYRGLKTADASKRQLRLQRMIAAENERRMRKANSKK